jgi:hypothetical protein
MTDRNPMLQNLNNPVPGLGVIPGKCSLDFNLISEYQKNAEDPRTSLFCYPGGQTPQNHDCMPGDTSFGQKDVRNAEVMDGEPNELGIVSVAGLNFGRYCSQREMEDDFYWQGVVTTESRLTNPLDGITGDPDHGYGKVSLRDEKISRFFFILIGTGRAGTFSVINNGWKTIYAGNYVCWQFPAAPFHPKGDVYNFNGGETINHLARYGTPPTQFRPEYVPFDHSDFTVQFSAAFAAMSVPKSQNGVSDLGFVASLPNVNGYPDSKPHSGIQVSFRFAESLTDRWLGRGQLVQVRFLGHWLGFDRDAHSSRILAGGSESDCRVQHGEHGQHLRAAGHCHSRGCP